MLSQLKFKADRADMATKADRMELAKLTKSLRASPEMMASGAVGGGGSEHAGLASACCGTPLRARQLLVLTLIDLT